MSLRLSCAADRRVGLVVTVPSKCAEIAHIKPLGAETKSHESMRAEGLPGCAFVMQV